MSGKQFANIFHLFLRKQQDALAVRALGMLAQSQQTPMADYPVLLIPIPNLVFSAAAVMVEITPLQPPQVAVTKQVLRNIKKRAIEIFSMAL